MRLQIENWLSQSWYATQRPAWYLRLLEPVYRAALQRAQRKAANTKERVHTVLPLVVVGNITVGGNGKTPLVIALCKLAREAGFKPGIISSGYGRKSRATVLVKAGDEARLCGDEPLLLARRTGVPVAVAQRRGDAIARLGSLDVDLVLSDDGLQQMNLAWDIRLCALDGQRGIGNGHLLPAGPLRVPVAHLFDVDYVICKDEWPVQPAGLASFTMRLLVTGVCSLDEGQVIDIDEFLRRQAGAQVHAVAGIGNPGQFFDGLQMHGFAINRHPFSDHHAFCAGDFNSMRDGRAIIMTEKDAVKCRGLGLDNAWYVAVDAALPEDFKRRFEQHLQRVCKDKK